MLIKNPNHPKKGSIIRVNPIRKKEHIQAIKALLKNQPRNLALFTFGINTALRASDILQIKVDQVEGLKIGESFVIREKKTKKVRRVFLNKATHQAIKKYLKVRPKTGPNAPLFLSRIGKEKAITVSYLNNLVKLWGKEVGVRDNLGSHSLRKSFGYHQRLAGTSLPILLVAFNHSNQQQTLSYLGIEEEELTEAFLHVI